MTLPIEVERKAKRRKRDRIKLALTLVAGAVIGMGITILFSEVAVPPDMSGRGPMNIVNVMWAGGTPYMSIHKVHRQVLSHAGADARISNWLLLGSGLCCGLGSTRSGICRHGR